MCVEPTRLPEVGEVACRKCWQCRANRINDYVGRCIAEQTTSTDTMAVTLTYSDDLIRGFEEHAVTLVYADFQQFIKRLRNDGYNVRYIVAGEYGSDNGRAHWHAVLFYNGKAPKRVPHWEIERSLLRSTENLGNPCFTKQVCELQNMYWHYWPHGTVRFEKPEYEGFRYILKYALKNMKDTHAVAHVAMSKKPPLGHDFFMQRAEKYVAQGISPQSPHYEFRHSIDRYDGKRRKYWLQGRMREIFNETYINLWEETHGVEYPFSEMLEEQQDKWIRENTDKNYEYDTWRKLLDQREKPYHDADPVAWDYTQTAWQYLKDMGANQYAMLPGPYYLPSKKIEVIYKTEKDVQRWLVSEEEIKAIKDAMRRCGITEHKPSSQIH